MDSVVAIPQQIVDWLSKKEELSDISFFTEFPPTLKAVPLKKAIVAVGIEEMSIVDKFAANDDGVLERQEYCRTANIKARLSICVPYSYGGTACHDYFTKIINSLTFQTDLNIEESGCSEIESDRNTSALVCHGWFKIIADFCPASNPDESFTSIFDKSFICGSHIKDDSIHITAQDKQNWDNHIHSGFYIGNSQSSRSINLGFKPKFMLVFCTDYPFATTDFTAKTSKAFMAMANENYSSAGLTLTSSGFKLSKATVGAVTTALNEAAISYGYIAFR